MNQLRQRKRPVIKNSRFAIAAALFLLAGLAVILWFAWPSTGELSAYKYVSTIAGLKGEFGEPFGIAASGTEIYLSDGQHGKIWRIKGDTIMELVSGLDTPSGIAIDKAGSVIVADPGSHTIKSVGKKGDVTVIAGVNGRQGFADGDAASSLFNAPVGVAVAADGKIYVADTYNDRIRVIENGKVTTIAGSQKGFSDGLGEGTKFDTPSGLAIWQDKLLVADTGNRRIRVVEADGRVWTLAGNGDSDVVDGSLYSASFFHPTDIAVDRNESIFVTDGNAIRKIGGVIPVVTTISAQHRGLKDGYSAKARFNRPSGIALDGSGNLIVADSENRLVRRFSSSSSGHEISAEEIAALRDKPDEFRTAQPARWPYDPPTAKRDIAGTLAEIRGEMKEGSDDVWFHNGLDIAGAYGETARFIRDEKVLKPIAAENFGTLRELIRMPTLGYIHIRLGRNVNSEPVGDSRFQFEKDNTGKLVNVRVPRGAKFRAGDPIGTLNAMNHVHLVAGRTGSEMNALDALILPGIADTRPPVIEKVTIYDQKWDPVETVSPNSRIKLTDKIRVVVRAYDQVDGNSERRRLGVYKLGYQILKNDKVVAEPKWTIVFDRMPSGEAIRFVYANESHSGATGETIFNYIVTNVADGDEFREDFIDPAAIEAGTYVLRVLAADYFGNIASNDIEFEVVK